MPGRHRIGGVGRSWRVANAGTGEGGRDGVTPLDSGSHTLGPRRYERSQLYARVSTASVGKQASRRCRGHVSAPTGHLVADAEWQRFVRQLSRVTASTGSALCIRGFHDAYNMQQMDGGRPTFRFNAAPKQVQVEFDDIPSFTEPS